MPEEILLNKSEVNYRLGDGESSCGSCSHYIPPEGCQIVKGKIESNGLCDLFEPDKDNQPINVENFLFGGPQ